MGKYRKMTIKMTYEVIILGHLHMPLYFIGTFTEYSYKNIQNSTKNMSVMTKCQPTMLNHFHTTGCKCPLCHTGKLFLTTNLYTILSSIDKNFVL